MKKIKLLDCWQRAPSSSKLFEPILTLALASGLVLAGSVTVNAADFMNGAKVYAEHCESCHGSNGQGVAGSGELTGWYQLMKPDDELFKVIRDGILAMPGYDSLLTSDEVLDVIAYMRTFQ